jgi:hypothetical protein
MVPLEGDINISHVARDMVVGNVMWYSKARCCVLPWSLAHREFWRRPSRGPSFGTESNSSRDDLAELPVESSRHNLTQELVADMEWASPDLPLFAPDIPIANRSGETDLDRVTFVPSSSAPSRGASDTAREEVVSPRQHASWLAHLGFDPTADVDLLPLLPPLPARATASTLLVDSNVSAILPAAPMLALSGSFASASASDWLAVSPPRTRPFSTSRSISDEEIASPARGVQGAEVDLLTEQV